MKRFWKRFREWFKARRAQLNGTETVVYLLALLAAGLAGGILIGDCGLPSPWGGILAGVLCMGAAALALQLCCLVWKLLTRRGFAFFLCTAACTAALGEWIYRSCRGNVKYWLAMAAALVIVLIVRTFGRCLWAILRHHRHGPLLLTGAIVTGLLTAGIAVLTVSGGFEDAYLDAYLRLGEAETVLSSEDPSPARGKYPVATLYYGTGEAGALESDTVDLGPYVGGYTGLQRRYRQAYQGYDIWNVPLRGKVWYPEGAENCPLLVIAHGNHSLTAESYEGYDYLGEALAAKGYVVASIDANACNWCILGNLSGENDGRAVLLLENIRQLLSYSGEAGNPLSGRIDGERIAALGHSRGGESAAIAALFCTLERYPGNGNIRFNWDFSIRSVIAVAPTVDQYHPAGHSVELTDVNYLLLQGANDQDVSVFMGARQYENVSFSGEADCLKSSLYIAGANHGQFNAEWGRFDMTGPAGLLLNVKNLLTAGEQQDILLTFAGVFLDVTLKGDDSCRSQLSDCAEYRAYLPDTVYVQNYEDSGFRLLADFEDSADLTSEQDGEVEVSVSGASSWDESVAYYANPSMDDGEGLGTCVLNVNWSGGSSASLEFRFHGYDGSGQCIQFDIADTDEVAVADGEYENLDCAVCLRDRLGHTASLRLKDYCTVYPPLPIALGKLQYLVGDEEFKTLGQTCRIPVADFLTAEPELDVTQLTRLTLVFDERERGSAAVDNVGFGDWGN